MKTKFLLPLFLLAVGCTSEKTEQTDDQLQTTEVVETSACYASVTGGDSTLLRIVNENGEVTGELTYNHLEKDDNVGTIMGEMHGDTLLADYTFMSEGIESVRQVAFLKKGEGFVEGYGDAEERDGKMVFKSTSTLDFGSGTTFEKVPCKRFRG
ncbi:hypothetical protein [Persicitalea jodogahamensis]|uniref:Lipoprotein n=1 Tax=Persicitalea jodogahamensis TaxID=402147 RepID=A0A8J3GB39_9BACT|nr:hypothetical protein [Persicitalea jodogahamensis]GHB78598.1 hypothetical protein GCM10007390_36180 [Persicitalea jodogahamensis]